MLAVLSGGIEPEPKRRSGVEPSNQGGNPCASLTRHSAAAARRLQRQQGRQRGHRQYDQNTAENTAADVGNTAQNIAADIGNDVKTTGDKIENKVGNTDVNVNVNTDVKTDRTRREQAVARRLDRPSPTSGGWSGRQDSNLRPSAPKADALPGCATPRRRRTSGGASSPIPCSTSSADDGGPGRIRTSNLAVMSGRLYR